MKLSFIVLFLLHLILNVLIHLLVFIFYILVIIIIIAFLNIASFFLSMILILLFVLNLGKRFISHLIHRLIKLLFSELLHFHILLSYFEFLEFLFLDSLLLSLYLVFTVFFRSRVMLDFYIIHLHQIYEEIVFELLIDICFFEGLINLLALIGHLLLLDINICRSWSYELDLKLRDDVASTSGVVLRIIVTIDWISILIKHLHLSILYLHRLVIFRKNTIEKFYLLFRQRRNIVLFLIYRSRSPRFW